MLSKTFADAAARLLCWETESTDRRHGDLTTADLKCVVKRKSKVNRKKNSGYKTLQTVKCRAERILLAVLCRSAYQHLLPGISAVLEVTMHCVQLQVATGGTLLYTEC
jgi:hypothetical protein